MKCSLNSEALKYHSTVTLTCKLACQKALISPVAHIVQNFVLPTPNFHTTGNGGYCTCHSYDTKYQATFFHVYITEIKVEPGAEANMCQQVKLHCWSWWSLLWLVNTHYKQIAWGAADHSWFCTETGLIKVNRYLDLSTCLHAWATCMHDDHWPWDINVIPARPTQPVESVSTGDPTVYIPTAMCTISRHKLDYTVMCTVH